MDFSPWLFHISIESDLVIHQDQGEELGKDEEPGELGDTSNSYLTDQQHLDKSALTQASHVLAVHWYYARENKMTIGQYQAGWRKALTDFLPTYCVISSH